MKILFLAQRAPFPPNKGEKIRTFNQLKYLTEQGHSISVCAPIEQNQDANYFKELADKYCQNITYHTLPFKPLRLLKGLLKGQSLSVANFYVNELQNKLDSLLQREFFDVVICTSSAMAEYIYKSKSIENLQKTPLLLMDFMDLDSDKWQQYADSSAFPLSMIYQREANILAKYEQKIQRTFDACFFIADAEVNLFKQRAGAANNVFTLGNGMCTNEFYPVEAPPKNPAPVFLFTGVMDYKPNVDAVLWFAETVWQGITAEYPSARFIIAGMNPTSSVSALTAMPGIEVTGFVDDILPYYHQADYFIAPFRLARGVQNKVLQAFACGLPVIATPMGAEGIDCQEGRDILIANQTDEFLAAINQLESNEKLKQALKGNALELIKRHYSWEGKLQVLGDTLAKADRNNLKYHIRSHQ